MLPRHFFLLFALSLSLAFTACDGQSKVTASTTTADGQVTVANDPIDYKYAPPAVEGEVNPIDRSEDYWRSELTDQAFNVLREDGTERSFTSPLLKENRPGVFTCGGCGLPLFSSDTKFKSGTGWPSFYEPIHPNYIQQDEDYRYGMKRVEVSCARCGGHQGHVFPDGPEPTGLRYCINGVSLNFAPLADIEGRSE